MKDRITKIFEEKREDLNRLIQSTEIRIGYFGMQLETQRAALKDLKEAAQEIDDYLEWEAQAAKDARVKA